MLEERHSRHGSVGITTGPSSQANHLIFQEDADLLSLKPNLFEREKRGKHSIDDAKESMLGTGVHSTITRELKIAHRPVDIMRGSTLKDKYL